MTGGCSPGILSTLWYLYFAYFDKEAIYGNGSERTRCCYCPPQ